MALPLSHQFFDPSLEFIKAKQAYQSAQGSRLSAKFGQLWYPKTTWGQVVTFYAAWLDYIDEEKCQRRLPPGYYTGDECKPTRSASYNRALNNFAASTPMIKSGNVFEIAEKIMANEEYPYNEDFWGYGKRHAIEHPASVNLPSAMDNLFEAIEESIDELPGRIKDALMYFDPRKLLPKMPFGMQDLITWSIVGVGVYGIYWMWKRDR